MMSQTINELDDLKKLRILYVEDDEDVRSQLVQFFSRRCGQLVIAADGAEGLRSFNENPFDLIVTDILMPVMDGLTMAQKIREINPRIPIIVTTAFEQTDFMMRAIALGIDFYVVKPVNMELLLRALHDCARRLRLEEESRLAEMVFQNSSESMLVSDADGLILSVNPAFTRLTGYAPDEVVGKDFNFLKSGRHDADFFKAMWSDLNTTGKWHGEIWNRRKDGEIYNQWLSIDTISNPDGSPHRRVGLFFDITRIKALELADYQAHGKKDASGLNVDPTSPEFLRLKADTEQAFEFANVEHPAVQELMRLCIHRGLGG